MNYQETLDYLYHTLPMFSHLGSAAYKKDLTNTIAFCEHLGNPQLRFKSIHIGGTNGKGSVSHMLAATLQTAGYKTGLYTSPHLYDFRERIQVNGIEVDQAFVVSFVEKWKVLIEEIKPSFFETTVAMAFQFFAEQKVDVAVIEVGLGGRLDSTNIILPELSIITNISWDHVNLLGNTLQQIAGEKAGIIKQGVPVVIGERDPATAPVFENTAAEKDAPLYFASDHFSIAQYNSKPDILQVTVDNKQHGHLKKFELDLPGIYQTKNICTVLQGVALLKTGGFTISEANLKEALRNTKKITGLHGRWEVVHRNPTVVLEVAHNEAGMQQLLAHLQNLSYKKLHLIIGLVKDKKADTVLSLLPAAATFYFTHAHIPRALEARLLQQQAAVYNLNGNVYDDVNTALQTAITQSGSNDLIVVCGSIFLVAEVDAAALKSRFA